jgi:hypothetical protein
MLVSHINTKPTSRGRTDVAVGALLLALVAIALYKSDSSDEPVRVAEASARVSVPVTNASAMSTIENPHSKNEKHFELNDESSPSSLQDLAHDEDPETRQEAQALLAALTDEDSY